MLMLNNPMLISSAIYFHCVEMLLFTYVLCVVCRYSELFVCDQEFAGDRLDLII